MKQIVLTLLIIVLILSNINAQLQIPQFRQFESPQQFLFKQENASKILTHHYWNLPFYSLAPNYWGSHEFIYNWDYSAINSVISNQYPNLEEIYLYQYNANNQPTQVIWNRKNLVSDTTIQYIKWEYSYGNCSEIPDTAFEYNFYNGNYVLSEMKVFHFNNNCQIDSILFTDVANNTPQYLQFEYYYNPNGEMTELLFYDDYFSPWDTLIWQQFTYENGLLKTEQQRGIDRHENIKYEYIYNANSQIDSIYRYHNITFPLPSFLNLFPEEWALGQLITYQYNAQDNLEKEFYSVIDTNNQWLLAGKTLNIYDGDNDIIHRTFEFLDSASTWQIGRLDSFLYSHYVHTDEIEQFPKLSCQYTNPYSKGDVIQCDDLEMGKTYQITVYDILGRIIEQKNIVGGQDFNLNHPNLNTGLHILTISENGKLLFSKKVMIE